MPIVITDPVGAGVRAVNRPSDVTAIQEALNGILPSDGGPEVKLVVDGKCGAKTKEAIQKFQLRHLGWKLADGRVDPGGPALAKINLLSSAGQSNEDQRGLSCHPAPSFRFGGAQVVGQSAVSLGVAPKNKGPAATVPAAGRVTSPLAAALAQKQEAVRWLVFATGKLEHMRLILSKAAIVQNQTDQAIFQSLETHFHVGYRYPDTTRQVVERTRSRVGQLLGTFRLVMSVVSNGDQEFTEDLRDLKAFARAVPGGLLSSNASDKKLRFCPPYLTLGPMFRTAVIVHEGAHYVDSTILHFASELPAPNGSAVDSAKNYVQLSWDEARCNAYSYAQFAIHSVENRDRRLTFPTD